MREARGLGTTQIAQKVGVTRQTIHAIESGDYVPNTAVALQLARVLEVRVEDLFSLSAEETSNTPGKIDAKLLAGPADEYASGELVSVARVGSHSVAAPAPRFPTFLSDADGAIAKSNRNRTTIRPSMEHAFARNRLVIAGCDPALSLLAQELKNIGTDVLSVHSSSQQAIQWLRAGLVHVAGSHLRDRATGEYNLPLATSVFGEKNVRVVTFAEWEQGLVVRRGNPKDIRDVPGLASKNVTIVNREKGSGARDLLDNALRAATLSPKSIRGYDNIVPSHLAAAIAVATHQSDSCVATVSAARCLGLDFVPLSRERFDLIVDSAEVDTAGIRFMFDVLNRASLRRKLVSLAGYEVRHTGAILM
jgi:molybdate-binding protein/DNA-binding XRE family transcriptional regulator